MHSEKKKDLIVETILVDQLSRYSTQCAQCIQMLNINSTDSLEVQEEKNIGPILEVAVLIKILSQYPLKSHIMVTGNNISRFL